MDKIGIYAGSFDPITYGHLDIIEKASKVFDTLYISVGVNIDKKSWFDSTQKIYMIQEATKHLKNVKVTQFAGLLVNYADMIGAKTIVRGIRGVSDLEYELQIGYTNKSLNRGIETVFFMPDINNSFISSSIFRAIYQETQTFESVKHLVPECVKDYLRKKDED